MGPRVIRLRGTWSPRSPGRDSTADCWPGRKAEWDPLQSWQRGSIWFCAGLTEGQRGILGKLGREAVL